MGFLKNKKKDYMEKWPNFFIVGAAKAGTTSLYEILKDFPEIYMCPYKEPNYFNKKTMEDDHPLPKFRTEEKYLKLFENVTNQKIIGEASHYLKDSDAPNLIHQVSPKAKILISLRDPVERVYSEYLMLFSRGLIADSFRQEIEYKLQNGSNPHQWGIKMDSSLYSENIKRYLKIFGHEQVKIIIFEEFIKNTKETIEEILKFLELDKTLSNFSAKKHNPYVTSRGPIAQQIRNSKKIKRIARALIPESTRRTLANYILLDKSKPKMSEKDRETLIKFYKGDVEQLKLILGRKLPWKNFM